MCLQVALAHAFLGSFEEMKAMPTNPPTQSNISFQADCCSFRITKKLEFKAGPKLHPLYHDTRTGGMLALRLPASGRAVAAAAEFNRIVYGH